MKRSLSMLAGGLTATLCASQALAGGILVARFGGEHGHAATDNLTSIYYNPAGLSLGVGTRLMIDGTFAYRNLEYTRDPAGIDNPLDPGQAGKGTTPDGIGANSGNGSLTNYMASPFLAVASDFGVKGLGVGFAAYVPFGGQSKWDKQSPSSSFAGQVDGAQRWWIMEGSARSVYLTTAASYRFEPLKLSVGVGLNYVMNSINTSRARNSDGTDDITSGNCSGDEGVASNECSIQEGRVVVDLKGTSLSFGAGLMWEPTDNMRVGLGYQASPTLTNDTIEGEADIIVGGGPVSADRKRTDAELRQNLPDMFRLAWVYEPTVNWQVRVKADYERWEDFKTQCILDASNPNRSCDVNNPVGDIGIIPRYWENTFGFGAGASYYLDESHDIEILGGAEWDPSVVPDSTLEASYYDADKLLVTVGGRFELLEDSLALMASYTQIFYADQTIAPRGRTDGGGPSNLEAVGLQEGERNPDAAGDYSQNIGVMNIDLEYTF